MSNVSNVCPLTVPPTGPPEQTSGIVNHPYSFLSNMPHYSLTVGTGRGSGEPKMSLEFPDEGDHVKPDLKIQPKTVQYLNASYLSGYLQPFWH